MHRTVGNGHVPLTGDVSAPVKHRLGCPPPKRGLIKHYARHVTAGIFSGLFGGSKGSTKVGFRRHGQDKVRSIICSTWMNCCSVNADVLVHKCGVPLLKSHVR